MLTCEQCRDRLLDDVYGLLEDSEAEALREHVSVCAACQSALEAARAEQAMLARAAHAVLDVAEFAVPAAKPDSTHDAPTLPMIQPQARPVPAWRRTWAMWSAAAAILIAVGLGLSYHRQTANGLRSDLAEAKRQYQKAADEFAALPAKFQVAQDRAIREVEARKQPHLHVVGPTTLAPGAKGRLHIATREIDGNLARASIRMRLVDTGTGKVVQFERLECDKETSVELDAGATGPDRVLKLIVEADSNVGKARIEQNVRTLPAAFATRIDTNKSTYQHRDVMFFRVLVLDRYTLRPPTKPIAMRVELRNPAGQPVRSLDLPTDAGGILAREFAVDESLPSGSYTLSARPIDPDRDQVQAAAQRLEIVRELVLPEIVLDRDRYHPGDQVTGVYRGAFPLADKALIGPQQVPLTTQPQYGFGGGGFGGALAPGGGGSFGKAKKATQAAPRRTGPQRIITQIPANVPADANRVPLTLKARDGKKLREIRTDIALAPSHFAIDFFPEGGDLIAGVENRVYYRVRSKSGEPVTGDGKVILFPGKKGPIDSSYNLGMGFFDFVPEAKETYAVRITTPTKTENIADPFAGLGMRVDGVVLHVPNAVGAQGEPIRLTLRHRGAPRSLMLTAQCRGQIVDQRWTTVANGSSDIMLHPAEGAVGMIRVTAYELGESAPAVGPASILGGAAVVAALPKEKTLMPVAERLVYRRSTQRLQLGFQVGTQQLHAGRKLTAKVTATDEAGRPTPAWMLASVVDERFQTRPRSLSAHFFLLDEVRTGADLDEAQIIVSNGPESTAVLERFLGTHGWRRFVRAQEPSLGILTDPAKRPAQPLVFSRESHSLQDLREKQDKGIEQARAEMLNAGFHNFHLLQDRVALLAQEVNVAADRLNRYEEAVQVWIRLALGAVVLVLLAISLVLMIAGIIRILRGHKSATPSFGGAFACLIACLSVYFLGGWLGPVAIDHPERMQARGPAVEEMELAPKALAARNQARPPNSEVIATGAFPVAPKRQGESGQEKADGQKARPELAANHAAALRSRFANELARRDRGASVLTATDPQAAAMHGDAAKKPLEQRFNRVLEVGKVANGKADVLPLPAAPAKGAKVQPPRVADDGRPALEYAYQHSPYVRTDTLLWHPNLHLVDGNAEVRFDVASGQATYRVLLLGHTSGGRLGFFESRLDIADPGR